MSDSGPRWPSSDSFHVAYQIKEISEKHASKMFDLSHTPALGKKIGHWNFAY